MIGTQATSLPDRLWNVANLANRVCEREDSVFGSCRAVPGALPDIIPFLT